ncbi:MAG: hypothetical protein ACFFES_17865 [Candidatus Thorarchaeota archaeon]
MKRNQCTLLGVLLAAVALMFVASGCSTSNPVAPDTSDIVFENPQSTPYYPEGDDPSSPTIDADRVADVDDVTVDQALTKSTPSIPEFIEGETTVVGDRDLVDDIAFDAAID